MFGKSEVTLVPLFRAQFFGRILDLPLKARTNVLGNPQQKLPKVESFIFLPYVDIFGVVTKNRL